MRPAIGFLNSLACPVYENVRQSLAVTAADYIVIKWGYLITTFY